MRAVSPLQGGTASNGARLGISSATTFTDAGCPSPMPTTISGAGISLIGRAATIERRGAAFPGAPLVAFPPPDAGRCDASQRARKVLAMPCGARKPRRRAPLRGAGLAPPHWAGAQRDRIAWADLRL